MPEPAVLIANRGEIAVRVVRAARSLGLRTVAVYTPEDHDALHLRLADEAHLLSGPQGYLDAAGIVEVAIRTGARVVHPGYGFLAESAEFARLCADAGLVFAGPSGDVLDLFGDKARSRELAASVGLPVLAATEGDTSLDQAREFLAGLGAGAAVMVKAVGGGGGRGLRVVRTPDELETAIERCRSEAERAFGRSEVFVEQLLPRARHVEVQVIGDGQGGVSHLWDRDCSVQRRHQKIIEIAPCLTVPEDTRARMWEEAVRLFAAVEGRGLGTVEFLVDLDDPSRHYFLELNPRVQVEHTVTEEVTGVDLVAAQLEVALGRTLAELGLTQPDVPPARGVAVQCRVNAERLSADGLTRASTGVLTRFEVPSGPGVRVDTAGFGGIELTGRFDSLLAKVVVHDRRPDLSAGAAQALGALATFRIGGVETNLGLLQTLLHRPELAAGEIHTAFVDERLEELLAAAAPAEAETDPAVLADAAPAPSSAGPPPAYDGDPAEAIVAPFPAVVVQALVEPGASVAQGAPVLVLESMKMEHLLHAPAAGVVAEILAEAGASVAEGQLLVRLEPDGSGASIAEAEEELDLDHVRPDLAEVVERHRVGLDEARPDAVARRRRTGQRTARENIAHLVDDGSFAEYGALAIAAQKQRRSMDDLIANTPADGMVTGIGTINADTFGAEASRCVVMSYDYTVLAGTQGYANHKKTDRMLDLAHRQQLPVVLFAEGGGGRPGDTDAMVASGLDVHTFTAMGRLSGRVPSIGIVSGRCFAGNAALLGCCDVIIATKDTTLGMGGPAMIEGGGLGTFRPEEVGPMSVQGPNGVVDILVEDEEEAVATAQRYLSYFQGPVAEWSCADQRQLRFALPENRVRVYDVRRVIELVADTDSVLELRREFGVGIVTALARIEGRPVGLVANDPAHLGGAIDAPSADKLARFLQLCDAHGLPVLSLCDTPGFMVGPDAERTATVRHFSRLFVIGGHLSVPLVTVVLRKAYGLGAQAMAGGSFGEPYATLAWPTGEVGGMGLEGAVRLGYRKELEAVADPAARKQLFDTLLAELYERGKAVNAATVVELDDVIDPAETRARVLAALPAPGQIARGGRYVDTW